MTAPTAPQAAGAREPAARLARSWRGRGDRPRGRWWAGPVGLVALLCLGSFTVSLVLQATLYRHGSGDADEAAYVLQARMLLHGRLTLDAASMEPFFRPWLTGEHGGRLFTKYLPGWPALLAASQAAFGTMAVAPALVAAAWVAGTYQLARELFDDAATGLLAAAAVALSPLVWLHTALPLAYGCGAATLTLTAAALLRGARTASRGWLLAAGAGAGFALLLRPYDAVLVLAPVAAFALLRLWRDVRRGRVVGGDRTGGDRTDAGPTDAGPTGVVAVASRRAGWVLLGAAPFLALLLAYCWWVTGSPLRMPLSASDPLDRFGFGPRRILPSEPTFPFGRRLALKAARQTVEAAPSWLFGGSVLAVLAAVGALGARRRGARLLLVAMVLAVVGGYLFWWGSAFAMPGLRTGLGPHYHLAALSPVVILAAAGARSVWSAAGLAIAGTAWARAARPATAGALVVLMGALTVASLPGKVRDQRGVNDRVALVHALLPREYSAPSVVVVTPDTPSRYTQVPFQTLRNGPDLSGRVLYAADLGPATATLPDRMPGRTLYRLRPGEIVDPAAWLSYHGSFTLLRPVDAARVRVELQVSLPAGAAPTSGVASTTGTASALAADVAPAAGTGPVGATGAGNEAGTGAAAAAPGAGGAGVTAYVRVGAQTRTFALAAEGGPPARAAVVLTAGAATGDEISLAAARLPGEVVVGLSVPTADGPARWEERIPIARRAATGELTLLTPGLGWRWLPSRAREGWLPAPVRPTLTTTVTPAGAAAPRA